MKIDNAGWISISKRESHKINKYMVQKKEKIDTVNSSPIFIDFPIFFRDDNFVAVNLNSRIPITANTTPTDIKNKNVVSL
jgi:hypothetical protein